MSFPFSGKGFDFDEYVAKEKDRLKIKSGVSLSFSNVTYTVKQSIQEGQPGFINNLKGMFKRSKTVDYNLLNDVSGYIEVCLLLLLLPLFLFFSFFCFAGGLMIGFICSHSFDGAFFSPACSFFFSVLLVQERCVKVSFLCLFLLTKLLY